jgi:lipoic acid synthetase
MRINRLPAWFRQELPNSIALKRLRLLCEFKINTVCKEANCPNLGECFKNSRLTFMILGNTCTRNCRFCAVEKKGDGNLKIDLDEPTRIAAFVKRLRLRYAVITSVTRQDLADGGAAVFAKTVELVRAVNSSIKIEILIPDFCGSISSIKTVVDAGADVVGHNIETVKRLHKELKPEANYETSLEVLAKIKTLKPFLVTKSSLLLGLGESEEEVIETMSDLRDRRCDILILGQYLAPSVHHYPVKEFINLGQFQRYRQIGISLGFKEIVSTPIARSSYRAEEVYYQVVQKPLLT